MTRRPAGAACAALPLALLVALAACAPAAARAQRPAPSSAPVVVVDASDFLHEIQKGHTITDAAALRVPWVFNNTALELRTRSNYVIRARVPAAGTYHLYVRSHGAPGSAFRVAVGDRVIDHDVGTAPMRLERAGTFELRAGEVDVPDPTPRPARRQHTSTGPAPRTQTPVAEPIYQSYRQG
jgi:hypothetical protein